MTKKKRKVAWHKRKGKLLPLRRLKTRPEYKNGQEDEARRPESPVSLLSKDRARQLARNL